MTARLWPAALSCAILLVSRGVSAQTPQPTPLTLQSAEQIALTNHPQIQAANDFVAAAKARVTEARAAYYPDFNADTTGSQANPRGRVGAGFLTTPSLFNRLGVGFSLNQLITDSGRTPNLVAESRLRADATQQDYQATRYDVLIGV
ncbi:MAG TPA: TolC family protein, partial [Vicinamibacterales bacterium]